MGKSGFPRNLEAGSRKAATRQLSDICVYLKNVTCFCTFLSGLTGFCLLSIFLARKCFCCSHMIKKSLANFGRNLTLKCLWPIQRAFGILWHLTAFPSSKTDINQKPPIQNKNARQNTTYIPPILGKSGLET